MKKISWHPGTLLETSGNYWQACTLHAAVKLDIFTYLADSSMGAEALAGSIGADTRGLTMLLNALAAMELLVKTKEQYDLTDAARKFLVSSSRHYIGYMILHHHHLVHAWARMDEAVRGGKPVRSAANSDGNDVRREAFLMGMYNIASQQAPDIASKLNLDGREQLLDLGGGPGTYAIHFCLLNPGLRAVVYDLPTTRPFAEKTIQRHGLVDRIGFVSGDYIRDDLEGPYDVVWLSHILHAEGPQECYALVAKAAKVLKRGGMLIVHDFILKDAMDGPLFPALFALNMLQGTDSGQSYSEEQIGKMMEKAGLGEVKRLDYCGPTESGIMMGIKR